MMWTKIRVPLLLVLMVSGAYVAGRKHGFRAGIVETIGGNADVSTPIVEWADISKRKVVVYLSDGCDGYSFYMTLDPKFRHYTAASKVFTCDNTDTESIKACMDKSRAWARDDWEGGDTRIVAGEFFEERNDIDRQIRSAEMEELEILREDVNRMALQIQNLKSQLEGTGK